MLLSFAVVVGMCLILLRASAKDALVTLTDTNAGVLFTVEQVLALTRVLRIVLLRVSSLVRTDMMRESPLWIFASLFTFFFQALWELSDLG